MLGTIKRDLLVRGLDPNNVEIGPDGTFVEKKTKPVSDNTTEEKVHKNALVQLSSEITQSFIAEDKSIKVKRKPKSE